MSVFLVIICIAVIATTVYEYREEGWSPLAIWFTFLSVLSIGLLVANLIDF